MIPQKIALLTDSCADLSAQLADEHHIWIVPLRIRCEDGEYRDGVDIHAHDIYRRLRAGELPHTSLPTGQDVSDALDEIAVCGFNGDADLSLVDPEQRAAYLAFLDRSLEAARFLGAPSLTIHSNGLGEGGRVLRDYRELSDTVKLCALYGGLEKCAALAEKRDVTLNLEPLNVVTDHPGNFLTHTQTAAELIRLVSSSRLRVLYDVYHMQLNEGCLCETIRRYGDTFGHVHVADAPGRHEPGTGEIAYQRVYAALGEAAYGGLLGYELFPAVDTQTAVRAIMKD